MQGKSKIWMKQFSMELWHDIPVPGPDLEIRGGDGHPDPYIRGEGRPVSKKNFSALRAPVWSKNKGGGDLDPPPHTLGKQNKQAKEVYWPNRFSKTYGCYPWMFSSTVSIGGLLPVSTVGEGSGFWFWSNVGWLAELGGFPHQTNQKNPSQSVKKETELLMSITKC